MYILKNEKKIIIKTTKYHKHNLIILSHVNFLFAHMLGNSFVHSNLLPIIIRHGEVTKFAV
jgi:hypothetical protein